MFRSRVEEYAVAVAVELMDAEEDSRYLVRAEVLAGEKDK